jgi:hypothetical protein
MPICKEDKCKKYAIFGVKGASAQFCKEHRKEGTINVIHKCCIEDGCETQAHYALKGEKPDYCAIHKSVIMQNVVEKTCIYDNCSKRRDFGLLNGKAEYCSLHAPENYININVKRCIVENCNTVSTFGEKDKKPIHCFTHKTDKEIDLKSIRCIHIGCESIGPAFDFPGGKGSYCMKHRLPDMLNVRCRHCKYPGCVTQPTWGYPGESPQFCKTHHEIQMEDIINKRCAFDNCDIITPVFNYKGEKVGKYCQKHALENMINVRKKICNHDGCTITARFGNKDEKPLYCSKHKTNLTTVSTSKICEYEKCTSIASYGIRGKGITHCAKHKNKNAVRSPNKKCTECKDLAIYGQKNKPLHCEKHKKENELNLVEQPCKSCNLSMILDKDKLCEYCNPITFKTAKLAKQNALMAYLDARHLEGDSTDKIIDSSCGKERPDRVYDLKDKIIILECDENQHKERNCTCEQTRMVNIGQMYGGTPVYFIRWNPDKYKTDDKNDDKIKDNEDIKKRYKLVGDLIESIMKDKIDLPKALISTIYLYYDNWNGLANEKWQIVSEFNNENNKIKKNKKIMYKTNIRV